MELLCPNTEFSVCTVRDYSMVDLDAEYCFIGKTPEEKSLVCAAEAVPSNVLAREDGWKCLKIAGVLDFGLVGILSKLTGVLANCGIPVFAVSTFMTDYVFMKKENFQKAVSALQQSGYEIIMR